MRKNETKWIMVIIEDEIMNWKFEDCTIELQTKLINCINNQVKTKLWIWLMKFEESFILFCTLASLWVCLWVWLWVTTRNKLVIGIIMASVLFWWPYLTLNFIVFLLDFTKSNSSNGSDYNWQCSFCLIFYMSTFTLSKTILICKENKTHAQLLTKYY